MDDLYAVLGVSKTATADEIKKAYRDAAFRYHPDRNGGDAAAEEKFKQINAAYAVLSDPDKRRQYDQYGHAAFDGMGGGGAGGFDFSGMDMGDIFGDIFGIKLCSMIERIVSRCILVGRLLEVGLLRSLLEIGLLGSGLLGSLLCTTVGAENNVVLQGLLTIGTDLHNIISFFVF